NMCKTAGWRAEVPDLPCGHYPYKTVVRNKVITPPGRVINSSSSHTLIRYAGPDQATTAPVRPRQAPGGRRPGGGGAGAVPRRAAALPAAPPAQPARRGGSGAGGVPAPAARQRRGAGESPAGLCLSGGGERAL